MKLTVKVPEIVPLEFTLKIDETEAKVMHALLWAARGDGAVRDICDQLFELFDHALDGSVGEYFDGYISAKQLDIADL